MDKKSVARRIQALLAKTEANGATEAEAFSAAEKARALMDQYQIEIGEVGLEEEGVAKHTAPRTKYKTLVIRDRIRVSIGEFCDCKVWKNREEIIFLGVRSDSEFAVWLLDALDKYITRGADNYVATSARKGGVWEARKGFVVGAINRINKRLMDAAAERRRQNQTISDGRSLVVVKDALVKRAFAALDINLRRSSRAGLGVGDGNAFQAGQRSGDRATFGRPVNGGSGTRQIGSR